MLNTMLMVLALASEPESAPLEDEARINDHPGACSVYELQDGCVTIPFLESEWVCSCPELVVIQGPWAFCEALGDGHYECPTADSYIVPADEGEDVTIHVRSTATSGDGWECDGEWCSLEYGLVQGEDDVPLPGEGPQCDEAAPDSCEPPPPKPRKIWIKNPPPSTVDGHPSYPI
jgi:hypothetical protein